MGQGDDLIGVLQADGVAVFHEKRPDNVVCPALAGEDDFGAEGGGGEDVHVADPAEGNGMGFVGGGGHGEVFHLGEEGIGVDQGTVLINAHQGGEAGLTIGGQGERALLLRAAVLDVVRKGAEAEVVGSVFVGIGKGSGALEGFGTVGEKKDSQHDPGQQEKGEKDVQRLFPPETGWFYFRPVNLALGAVGAEGGAFRQLRAAVFTFFHPVFLLKGLPSGKVHF